MPKSELLARIDETTEVIERGSGPSSSVSAPRSPSASPNLVGGSLPDGTILIGDAAGLAQSNPMTGMGTLSNSGAFALEELDPDPEGSFTTANITVDKYGRVTEATDGSIDPATIPLPEGEIFVGDASDLANAVPMSGAVTIAPDGTTTIANDAVGSAQIAANAVGSSEIAADAVGTSEIAASAVTVSELADDAVETAKIKDLNVTTGKIAALAVTLAKIATAAYASINTVSTLVFRDSSGDFSARRPTFELGLVASIANLLSSATTGFVWLPRILFLNSDATRRPTGTPTSQAGAEPIVVAELRYTDTTRSRTRVMVYGQLAGAADGTQGWWGIDGRGFADENVAGGFYA